MATNQLLPFANGDTPNVLDFATWNTLAARLTGFQSGIASAQQFNRILAQGGAAGYVIGQMVASLAGKDATIDAETLYTNFLMALKAYVGSFEFDDLPESWLDALMPAGEFVICAGTTLPPRTLLCNGAAVSRTTYSRLFTAIGTKYGSGDGSTTFNLPNLDGRVLQGTSDTSKVGQYLEASLPNITGSFGNLVARNSEALSGKMGLTYGAFSVPGSGFGVVSYISSFSSSTQETDGIVLNATTSSSVYSGTALQPKALNTMTCIRY